jgi:hypothetical protein
MIDLQAIENALRIIGASQSLTDSVPISACLIASSDAGKSATLLSHLPHGARVLDDLTTASLFQVLDSEPRPRVLVLPDLNQAISHRPTVVQLLMAALLSLMGEGLTEIPGIDRNNPFKLKADELSSGGLRVAVITALTPEMFFSHRARWRNIGLLRRLTPIFYKYPAGTIVKIQKKIQHTPAGGRIETYPRVYLPQVAPGAPGVPAWIAREIEIMSRELILNQLIWKRRHRDGHEVPIQALDLPFSIHKTLRTFVRASALLHRRKAANDADLTALRDFARFVRYDRAEEV